MKCGVIITITGASLVALLSAFAAPALAGLNLGSEEIVQAGGENILVAGFTVPSYVDWNNDSLADLIVGDGGGGNIHGKVRVYLNTGFVGSPAFTDYFYAQANGEDLVVPAMGCLGASPRVVHWNDDGKKDLIIGKADGMVAVYLNTNTDDDPGFDGGTNLQVGVPGSKVDIDVGSRATPILVDWNSDGAQDLYVGSSDGCFHLFLNMGDDFSPDFRLESLVQEYEADLIVPTYRSSPVVMDLDDDGNKDILTGNTMGQLLLYRNTGSNTAPAFAGHDSVESDGVPIELPDYPRTRPFACDWTGDGWLDLLVGAGDGQVHLYQGLPEPNFVLPDPALVCELMPPWPNPCNPRATISFDLVRWSWVQVSIHAVTGRRLQLLADGPFDPGQHHLSWQGRDDQGRNLASGLYLVRLETSGQVMSQKLQLLR